MRIALAGTLLFVALALLSGNPAAAQNKINESKDEVVGELKPSPIPEKMDAEAKKVFAKKSPYFIWTEGKPVSNKDLKLRYAVNPDQKAEPASTVARLTRAVKGRLVPYTFTSQGIVSYTNGPRDFKGTTDVTVYLIKETDQLKEDKAAPISNMLKVRVKFE
jgi:hypothetical protein